MTGLDYILIIVVALAAIGGFTRGFVQEVLSLAAWGLAIMAIRYLHTPLTDTLGTYIGEGTTTAILAFALLLLIPYAAMRVIANNVGKASRNSVLGPVDRVLGFGFGAIKGLIILVIAFSLIVLGYDTIWGVQGRPGWIVNARSYSLVDASSRSMVEMIADRRARLSREGSDDEGQQ